MKKLILCLIAGFTFAAAYAQVSKETDWHEMKLQGKVQSLREACYKAKWISGKIEKGKKQKENLDGTDAYTVFNNDGRTIEVDEFNDGTVLKKTEYVYDNKGIMSEVYSYNANDTLTSKHKYLNTYDDKGNLVTRIHLRADSSVDNKFTFVYNGSGNLVEYTQYRHGTDLIVKEICSYDNKGNMTEDIIYKPDGKIDWRFSYKNDDKGNRLEANVYKGKKFIIKYINAYDTYGNETEVDWCKESGKPYRKYYMKYEYDSHGNWIKQTAFKKDKPIYIFERELTYFSQ